MKGIILGIGCVNDRGLLEDHVPGSILLNVQLCKGVGRGGQGRGGWQGRGGGYLWGWSELSFGFFAIIFVTNTFSKVYI